MTDLRHLCDEVLIGSLPLSLRSAIRPFLFRHGHLGTEKVLALAKKRDAGPLLLLAIEAYCDQQLKQIREMS